MKTLLLSLFTILTLTLSAQITTPIVKAGFGVDADLKARIVNGALQTGDDWYVFPGTSGTNSNGTYVIDTTGAAAILAGYATDVSPFPRRMTSFFRGMSRPSYSIVNNRLWLDALFVRDYHANDTTVFVSGADKNGMSPALWSGGIQGIPDKNDILDMFMHVRRAGPNTTDSLWLFGALSLDQVTGNRYFDFELYQTDINYDRVSGKWYGYGPDAGHTSWQFDAAGNITRPGDIIFSAEYQSSSLTNIEARIWVDRASLSITPTAFNWSGQFDGASTGAQYGYASILPKTVGAFYTGLQCGNNEWPGAFDVVLQNNTVATKYTANQFMEFSVNLSKLGLDPVTVFGSDVCGTPFNRLVVKTRASASFTAELKDFVAPIDLFLAPRADIVANVPILCATQSVSDIWVQNPSSSSYYSWTTPDGHIVGSTTGTGITVDAPGTYIVTQRLSAGCNPYANDTVNITYGLTCSVMESSITSFRGSISNGNSQLYWTTNANNGTEYFEIERSHDGVHFATVTKILAQPSGNSVGNYAFQEDVSLYKTPYVFYRLKIKMTAKFIVYSSLLRLNLPIQTNDVLLYPNPAKDQVQLVLSSDKKQQVKMMVYDFTGVLLETRSYSLKQGTNVFSINTNQWKPGGYLVQLVTETQTINKKLLIQADAISR